MAKVEIDLEAVHEVGWLFGIIAKTFIAGFEEGLDDYEAAAAEDDFKAEYEREEGLKQPRVKTEIGDCRKCWCDQCAKLEECTHTRENALPDGVRPFPCIDCENGTQFKPLCEAPCEDFEQGEGVNNG